jgi:hypothetical protein
MWAAVSAARAAGAAAQAAQGQQQEGQEGPAPEPGFLGTLGNLLRAGIPGAGTGGGQFGGLNFVAQTFGRAPAGGGGGGFGGGGAGPLMPSGDYLVTITVAGKTMKRVLRVETADN